MSIDGARAPGIAIGGSGVAASTCAHLLARSGYPVTVMPGSRPPVPAILLSDAALLLIRDVFGAPALFADRPRITRRMVSWGGAEPVAMSHGAVMVSEADIAAALPCPTPADTDAPRSPAFAIHTASPQPHGQMRHFGRRRAMAAFGRLSDPADASTCWVEAVDTGWLFLIPAGGEDGWLLGVGDDIDMLVVQSRLVAQRIVLNGETSAAFDTCPRMLTPLSGLDWLACGTAAIAFDPICGDGTAQAVREAILACALIGGIARGGDAEALRTHYESMLIAAMRRHLMLSAQYYATGGQSQWWRQQHSALAEGHRWCTARLAVLPEPRYALRGFALVERKDAA